MLNKGELGIALTNNHNLGSKVAVMGMYSQGTHYAVHFNPTTGKGAYKESNGQGGRARNLAFFQDFDYSDKMKAVIDEISKKKK